MNVGDIMNAELMTMRKKRNLSEVMDHDPVRLDPDDIIDRIYLLNTNMSHLYVINHKEGASIDTYIEELIKNIYLILDIFNDMGIYPDYFYNIIVKINMEYRNLVFDGKIRGNYGLYQMVDFSSKISKLIKEGLEKKEYQLDISKSKDIGECFLEMISFFERYNMTYNNHTVENCAAMFDDIYYNINNIINNTLSNSDFLFVDIECLTRILFEYISFFVAIGVNPKKYLDEYIENENTKGKKR